MNLLNYNHVELLVKYVSALLLYGLGSIEIDTSRVIDPVG